MLELEELILYGVVICVSVGIGYQIFIEMFPQHRWKNKCRSILFGIGFAVSCMIEIYMTQAFDISTLGMIVCPVVHAFVLSSFYQCEYGGAFLWMWFYNTLIGIMKLPLLTVLGILVRTGETRFESFPGKMLEFLWMFLMILVISISHKLWKRTIFQHLKYILKEQRGILYGFSVLGWSMLTVILYIQQWYVTVGNLLLNMIVFGMLGAVFWKTCAYYIQMKRTKNDLMHQQAAWIREQKTMKEWYAKDAKRLHDTKHVLLFLQKCLTEHELEKAEKHLQVYTKEIIESQKKIWTGFSEIDFSVNYYHQIMQEEEIQFSIETDIQDVPIEEIDMMILLGNLLDNAMTAAGKCQEDHRNVHLKIQTVNEMFRMVIENSTNEIPERKDGRFLTSKKEKEYHGWGIENVKQLVEKYGGEITFQYTKEQFQTEILIYGRE